MQLVEHLLIMTNEDYIRWIVLVGFISLSLNSYCRVNGDANAVPPENAEYCDFNESDNAVDSTDVEPSFCQEVIVWDTPKLYHQDDFNILAALGTSVLNKTYPTRVNTTRAFITFDELPYPVPTGATSFFMVLLTVIFTWYFTKFLHWLLKDKARLLDLFPITDSFPNVNVYTLQQSRRESRLNRDSRNTWSWLATFYLLHPNDPDVNPDEVFKTSGWDDFQVPHDVWYIIKAVLRINAVAGADEHDNDRDATGSASARVGPTEAQSADSTGPSKLDKKASARLLMLRNLLKDKNESETDNSA